MKFSNTFKIIWWILLILLAGSLFYWRLEAIGSGKSAPVDIFIFLILVALLLAPIFAQVEFFGIKLKQEIEELKTQIKLQFGDIKNEIRNSQVQTIHQNISGFGPPPPDDSIPELNKQLDKLVREKLKEFGIEPKEYEENEIIVPPDNLFLFQVRYNIEIQIRRIWENRFEQFDFDHRQRHQSIIRIIQDLMKYEIIDQGITKGLREVLSICNYAIHGEEVTENQINFVKKNAGELLSYLRQTK